MANRTCCVEGCENRRHSRGLCGRHLTGLLVEVEGSAARVSECFIAGCDRVAYMSANHPGATDEMVCHRHWSRMKKSNNYAFTPKPFLVGTHGYIRVPAHGHLLADGVGYAYQHRLILFDAIGEGPHHCVWCERHVNWGSGLTVDHLDHDHANNDRGNLVQSCGPCNSSRGSADAPRFGQKYMAARQ